VSKKLWGLMAEFKSGEELVEAAKRVRTEGYRWFDAYSPFHVHGLVEAMGFKDRALRYVVLACGITGACSGYFLQWYSAVIDYPIVIGGRPLHTWPSFVPITFECTILFAAFGAVLGMLLLNGLPLPYHPVFNVKQFNTSQGFYLVIEAADPKFDAVATRDVLHSLSPIGVYDVAP
jgi:hypothetical protein